MKMTEYTASKDACELISKSLPHNMSHNQILGLKKSKQPDTNIAVLVSSCLELFNLVMFDMLGFFFTKCSSFGYFMWHTLLFIQNSSKE